MDSYYNQYINQYKIYTAMSADKLASFRVDSQLWEQFQGYAKENNVTATALLISYIKSVVNTGNVITSNPVINTSSEINNPSLSIHDIDKRIDDKIKLSIQDINTLSIQDIDNRIKESIADGDIKEVIANSYEAAMGQFNGLLEELQALQKQVQELKSNPPAAVPQLPITDDEQAEKNKQSHAEYVEKYLTPKPEKPRLDPAIVTRNYQIRSILEIQWILEGNQYNLNYLNDHVLGNMKQHKDHLETELNIKLNLVDPKYVVREFNKILRAMGCEIENKQIGKIETYWITNKGLFGV
jgi:hypothetical protein